MQVTETLNEGLKRKLAVVIPAADLNSRLDARLMS
jgi:trigger factor